MSFMPRRAAWLTRWATDTPVQVGIAGASWSVAGSYARGLLPRSPMQQAVSSGVVAATHYQLTATAWATLQALGALPGTRPGLRANLLLSAGGITTGISASALTQSRADDSMVAAAIGTAGRLTAFAALAGGASAAWDEILHRRLGLRPGIDTTLLPAVATGAAVVGFSIARRTQRARAYGVVAPERHAVAGNGARAALQATAVGIASGIGFAAATTGEQLLARALERGLAVALRREPGALGSLVAHGLILGSMGVGGVAALNVVTTQLQQRDDIVEPAYPTPPTSVHVSAGPASSMPFDSLGKEGRRFVLMALTPEEISTVMGQPAIEPVRVVGGYESADDVAERARLTLRDMEDVGAFDRSLICIGSPTGVGYFNYSLAEALEYLTLGDCAIVVPQYALVPSALALTKTFEAEELTALVVAGVRDRLHALAPSRRPRLVIAGESLGANVALDIATAHGGQPSVPAFEDLGIEAGLYLGVPFRTRLWNAWREDPAAVDPRGELLLVSQPDAVEPGPTGVGRHVMVVHHDDPVNKYGFRMVLQPPWWMGPPTTRPPLVPRETKFRPITSFVLATVDLFNGMQSKPGTFVRRGHDYRIDLREGVQLAFGLACTPAQGDAIDAALRTREQQWAARRMVARKLDKARRAIEQQLAEWGTPGDLADLDPNADKALRGLARLGVISGPPGA
ncbi:MAG: alpha/beta-hydrolase family protein [Actinomycetota bacterium]|nr:alpha/beta-hydrolase family protein [Actinomycetota bacterium]